MLVDFWTYSCINCLRAIPYVRAWAEKYKDQGLVVIGVHAPEFAFEKNIDNVRKAVADLKIDYPVAIDNDYAIWRAFNNEYWPAHYFIDAKGRIRHHHFGEGDYDESEQVIQQLLAEAGKTSVPADLVAVNAAGARGRRRHGRRRNRRRPMSAMTRAENFVSPGGAVQGRAPRLCAGDAAAQRMGLVRRLDGRRRSMPSSTRRTAASSTASMPATCIWCSGRAPDGKPVRFRVTIDGEAPGDSHGADIDADGKGVVTGQRLYQLVRQSGTIADHTFEIEFLDPGVQAYAFTFG